MMSELSSTNNIYYVIN